MPTAKQVTLMGKNSRRRREPQRPFASEARLSPRRQPIASGALAAVEAADAAALAGQLEDKSKFPFDSPNWIAVEYVHQLLCKMPRYVGHPSLVAEELEAEV